MKLLPGVSMGGEVLFAVKKDGVCRWGVGHKSLSLISASPRVLRGETKALKEIFGGDDPWARPAPFAAHDYGITVVDCDAKRIDSIQNYCTAGSPGSGALSQLERLRDGLEPDIAWHDEGMMAFELASAGWLRVGELAENQKEPVGVKGAKFSARAAGKLVDLIKAQQPLAPDHKMAFLFTRLRAAPPGWSIRQPDHGSSQAKTSELLALAKSLMDQGWPLGIREALSWSAFDLSHGGSGKGFNSMIAARLD